MGFSFRKSVGFGPIRVNFSKSGIGISTGVRGARISTGPRGIFINLGAGGIYYRQRIDFEPRNNHRHPCQQIVPNIEAIADNSAKTRTDITSIKDSSPSQLIDQLTKSAEWVRRAPILLIVTLVVTFLLFCSEQSYLQVCALLIFIVGFVGSVLLNSIDNEKKTVRAIYEFGDEALAEFNRVSEALRSLASVQRLWIVDNQCETNDLRRNAGASYSVKQRSASVERGSPPGLKTNIDCCHLKLGSATLYFLPDKILVKQGSSFRDLTYQECSVSTSTTRFVEEGWVPSDAKVVDQTWRFVNNNGSPDRRFNNNRQLPVTMLGVLVFRSSFGDKITLYASNIEKGNHFAELFNSSTKHRHDQNKTPAPGKPSYNSAAYRVLGVAADSSSEQIRHAYLQMVKMYHPDRLANLGRDLQNLASIRMQEINQAYETIECELESKSSQKPKPKNRDDGMIRFKCPHCSKHLKSPANKIGLTGTCTRCKWKMPIPATPE